MRRQRLMAVGLAFAGLVPAVALGTVAGAESRAGTAPFADARLKIELNATDGDAGLQVFLDAPAWREITITNPSGREVVDVEAEQVIRNFGLTELFAESSEPPFDELPFSEFKRLFPAGVYTFRGVTVDGQRLRSTFTLTHRVPDGPQIQLPGQDTTVGSSNLVVQWRPVTTPRGIDVVAYQVLVVADAPALGNPTRELDVVLPASATRFPVPAEFLAPGTYKVEVLAIERSGNQTLSEVAFTVR